MLINLDETRQLIEREIAKYRMQNREAKGILMHYESLTWFMNNSHLVWVDNPVDVKIFGLKVYRTHDIEPGKFKLL